MNSIPFNKILYHLYLLYQITISYFNFIKTDKQTQFYLQKFALEALSNKTSKNQITRDDFINIHPRTLYSIFMDFVNWDCVSHRPDEAFPNFSDTPQPLFNNVYRKAGGMTQSVARLCDSTEVKSSRQKRKNIMLCIKFSDGHFSSRFVVFSKL